MGKNQFIFKNRLKLEWTNGNIWKGNLQFNEKFEFKFILIENGKVKKWENGDNRIFNYSDFKNAIEANTEGTIKMTISEHSELVHDYNSTALRLVCKWKN
jgi:hypothetical protein